MIATYLLGHPDAYFSHKYCWLNLKLFRKMLKDKDFRIEAGSSVRFQNFRMDPDDKFPYSGNLNLSGSATDNVPQHAVNNSYVDYLHRHPSLRGLTVLQFYERYHKERRPSTEKKSKNPKEGNAVRRPEQNEVFDGPPSERRKRRRQSKGGGSRKSKPADLSLGWRTKICEVSRASNPVAVAQRATNVSNKPSAEQNPLKPALNNRKLVLTFGKDHPQHETHRSVRYKRSRIVALYPWWKVSCHLFLFGDLSCISSHSSNRPDAAPTQTLRGVYRRHNFVQRTSSLSRPIL